MLQTMSRKGGLGEYTNIAKHTHVKRDTSCVYTHTHTHRVTHKIMYTEVNFFFLGLSCSGKKGGKIWKNLFELNKQVNIRKSTLLDVK